MNTELHERLGGLSQILRDAAAGLGERSDEFQGVMDAVIASRRQAQLYGLDKDFNAVLGMAIGQDRLRQRFAPAIGDEECKGLRQVVSRMEVLSASRIQLFRQECQDNPAFAEVCSEVKTHMFPGLGIKLVGRSNDSTIVSIAGDDGLMTNMVKFQNMWAKDREGPGNPLGHFRFALETASGHLPKIIGDQEQAIYTAMLYAMFYACARMQQAGEDDACPAEPATSIVLDAAEG